MALERISGVGTSYGMNNSVIRPVESTETQNSSEENQIENRLQDAVNYDAVALINEQEEEKREFTDETIGQDLSDIRKKMANTECKFGIDDATNRITIKIVDKDTKKVIKEVPPEKTLKMIAKVWEMAGILVDEKL